MHQEIELEPGVFGKRIEPFHDMIHPNNQMHQVLYISGTYEPNSLLVLKKFLKQNDVFLDVGANAGIYTLFASRCVGEGGKIISFEPSSREYALLEENVQLNALRNVVLEKRAVSDACGIKFLRLAIEKHNGQNTLCDNFAYEDAFSSLKESVAVVSLDQYVKNNALKRINFIKMDIEGAELSALQGAKQIFHQYRPLLLMEICQSALKRNKISLRSIYHFFETYQYQTFSIDDQTAEIYFNDKFETWEENIFVVPREKVQELGIISS